MILICYDGSADARAAIAEAGEFLAGQHATVLTVWQPVAVIGRHAPTAFVLLPSLLDAEEIDQANADRAADQAQAGAQLACDCGLDAVGRTLPQTTSVAHAILGEAERIDASAILMGSRGLTGVKSRLLGSVSHAVVQEANRPVIVVPSPETLGTRRQHHPHTAEQHEITKR